MTFSANAAAMHRRAIAKTGQTIELQRITGAAPHTSLVTAEVTATVRNVDADTTSPSRDGYSSSQLGGITQGAREIIVLADDLAAANFPLPVRKNDRVILASGIRLNVIQVDAEKRAIAGAIELLASGAD